MYGDIVQKSLIIYLLHQLSRINYFVFMGVCLLQLNLWMMYIYYINIFRLERLIGNKRFLMMDLCVICFGAILMVIYDLKFIEIEGWGLSPRGAGYLFGGDVVDEFNRTNSIDLICRAH